MIYRGRFRGGIVIFDQPPHLKDGTPVSVQPESACDGSPRLGTRDALLRCRAQWSGPSDELERLLKDVQQMREADLIPTDEQ